MTTCEFKKECTMAAQGRPCPFSDSEAKIRRCDDRKFAILVVNRWVEKAIEAVGDYSYELQALKMEED